MEWQTLDVPQDPAGHIASLRLNALGSLYYFSKIVLRRNRLSERVHLPISRSLESEHLHLVLEIPRDHLKTTLVTESLSMWWALPFGEKDEVMMRELGYDDAWIRWMRRAHDPNNRTLIVSENESNAIRFGHRIDNHYASNDTFRACFPEILPDAKCTWNDKSKTHRRTSTGIGEGTFDFLGVGGAVQSRHYDRIIQDDLVGRDAKSSELIMQDTIEYHQLLGGVFDTEVEAKELGDEVVVGNRWSFYDLNGWIRENQGKRKIPWKIETHSAEGGCCDAHPAGEPIYFTREVLEEVKSRYTWEDYAHQFLNLAVLPEECPFRPEWLRYYTLKETADHRAAIEHETKDGKTKGDISVGTLQRALIVDPNHAEEKGRAHHAIVAIGYDSMEDSEYLLDVWAKSSSFDDLCIWIYKLARRWNIDTIWLEQIAAQQLLRYPLAYREKVEKMKLNIRYLTPKRTANFKDNLIRAKEPSFRNGKFWCRRDQTQFTQEYLSYPSCRTKDILNCIGYSNDIFSNSKNRGTMTAINRWNRKQKDGLEAR